MVKGAALLLQEDEKLETVSEMSPPPEQIQNQTPGQQEQHLHLMMRLLRPEDAICLVSPGGQVAGALAAWGR